MATFILLFFVSTILSSSGIIWVKNELVVMTLSGWKGSKLTFSQTCRLIFPWSFTKKIEKPSIHLQKMQSLGKGYITICLNWTRMRSELTLHLRYSRISTWKLWPVWTSKNLQIIWRIQVHRQSSIWSSHSLPQGVEWLEEQPFSHECIWGGIWFSVIQCWWHSSEDLLWLFPWCYLRKLYLDHRSSSLELRRIILESETHESDLKLENLFAYNYNQLTSSDNLRYTISSCSFVGLPLGFSWRSDPGPLAETISAALHITVLWWSKCRGKTNGTEYLDPTLPGSTRQLNFWSLDSMIVFRPLETSLLMTKGGSTSCESLTEVHDATVEKLQLSILDHNWSCCGHFNQWPIMTFAGVERIDFKGRRNVILQDGNNNNRSGKSDQMFSLYGGSTAWIRTSDSILVDLFPATTMSLNRKSVKEKIVLLYESLFSKEVGKIVWQMGTND